MSYRIELSGDEVSFIQACILGVMRRLDERSTEQQKIDFRHVAAQVITRINEARINGRDVMFISTCIVKTRELLQKDYTQRLDDSQMAASCRMCNELINKLQGVGAKYSVIEST